MSKTTTTSKNAALDAIREAVVQMDGSPLEGSAIQTTAQRIIQSVTDRSILVRDALPLWQAAEEAFMSSRGAAWQDLLLEAEAQEGLASEEVPGEFKPTETIQEPETAQPTTKPEAFHVFGLEAPQVGAFPALNAQQAEAALLQTIRKNEGDRVPFPVWTRAFAGACASRRAGIDWRTWARRVSLPRGVIARIAGQVWSMDANQLDAGRPVRAPF